MPMSEEHARKFARILLQEFAHEGHFDIVLPLQDLILVSRVLEEEHGVTTDINEMNERLTIHCKGRK